MNRDSVFGQCRRRVAPRVQAAGIAGLALLLQACGGSEDASPNGTAAVNAIDPCTLVTAPPRLATCRYTAPRGAGLAVMTVMVRQGYSDTEARTGFEGTREVFGDAENIDLGDQAFFAAEQLHVLSGTTHLTISGDFGSAVATDLAERALGRL